jgi:TonB family protein
VRDWRRATKYPSLYHLVGTFLWRARQNWGIGVSFGLAALIHFAVILLGANYHQPDETLLALSSGVVDVVMEPGSPFDDLTPPPEVNIPQPTPNLTEELSEERPNPPSVRERVNKPLVKARSGIAGSPISLAKGLTLSAPWPEYPPEARQRNITGNGVVAMTIDPVSGSVTHVSMWKSTGNSCLDDAALRGFRRWRFKPGSVSKVKSPVTFTLTSL